MMHITLIMKADVLRSLCVELVSLHVDAGLSPVPRLALSSNSSRVVIPYKIDVAGVENGEFRSVGQICISTVRRTLRHFKHAVLNVRFGLHSATDIDISLQDTRHPNDIHKLRSFLIVLFR